MMYMHNLSHCTCIVICVDYMQDANVQIFESQVKEIPMVIAGNEQIYVSSINKVVSWPSQLYRQDADGILVALTEEVRDLYILK